MTDDPEWTPDEPDFAQHLRNVLSDVAEGLTTPEVAYEAITRHPGAAALGMTVPPVMPTFGKPN